MEDDFQKKIVVDILEGRIFVSASAHFFDPLENLHLTEAGPRKVSGNYGLISFTDDPIQPEVWSKCAFWHRGVCFGFCTQAAPTLKLAKRVSYVDSYSSMAGPNLEDKLLVKPNHWRQESEWRIVIAERNHDYVEVPSSSIIEVTFGAACSDESEVFVRQKLDHLRLTPKIFRCRVANSEPRLERVLVEQL